jgi:cell filamentation protein
MSAKGKYDTTGLVEAQPEPGSRGRVLKNIPGIKSKRKMDLVEEQEQQRAMEELADVYEKNHRFTANDICKIHKVWLGKVYEWAGKYRNVNISKDGFLFASAIHVPLLMNEFEKGPLRKFTPCTFTSSSDIARAIAIVHTELVLIHPFREGNGRAARILAILMALQAGLPPLDFRAIRGKKRREYFSAVQAGLDRNYEPMERIFNGVIDGTIRLHGR